MYSCTFPFGVIAAILLPKEQHLEFRYITPQSQLYYNQLMPEIATSRYVIVLFMSPRLACVENISFIELYVVRYKIEDSGLISTKLFARRLFVVQGI